MPCRAFSGWLGRFLAVLAMDLAVARLAPAGAPEELLVVRQGGAELRLTTPREAGKVPVVFIHGMLGVPGNWSVMLERLGADPAIRARCQLLTFRYDGFQSIPESARQLRELLAAARGVLDPTGQDPGLERVVLVGHSLGGLVAKAAAAGTWEAQTAGTVAAPAAGPSRPATATTTATPRVARVVFVATPHHGTRVDRGVVQSVGQWVARTVSPSVASRRSCDAAGTGAGRARSSVDELTWDHPLLRDLEHAGAVSGIPFHSIIAVLGPPSAAGATDGVVPLASARLAGARSEVLVQSHHLCLQHPEVIQEVARVLNEDAAATAPGRAEAGRAPAGPDPLPFQPSPRADTMPGK
jgi:pimeloyl-ACP methyl ester carboxylesterase